MEITKETKEKLSWDIELCESSATIENGVLKDFDIKQKGPIPQGEHGLSISIPNEERLRQTHKAITELIQHLDKGRRLDKPISAEKESIASMNDAAIQANFLGKQS